MSRVEILAPAGSMTSLRGAVNAGADAVYVGGKMFSARAFAENFDTAQLQEALDFVHIHKRKLYLTVNTLLKNSEIKTALYDFLKPAYEYGLDAVIVQDFGVFEFIKANFPDLDIHASTQMTTNGEYSARFLEQKGATRVVTSRELSLEEIRTIRNTTNLEIESFVHGALCYSYSGQCLMSSMMGYRSGNRGRCAQCCRLPYTVYDRNKRICSPKYCYALSLKDICTLDSLPDIMEAGVYSLKIEGRMKKPEYTAGVVSVYRKYVDMYLNNGKEGYKVDSNDVMNLMDLFNRGNFTKGYYSFNNGPDMITMERPNHQGTKAIEVVSAQKGLMKVRALNNLNPQDIVDVSPEFTWTNGTARKEKEVFDIRIPADLRVNKGDVYYRVRNNSLIKSIDDKYFQQNVKEGMNLTGRFEAGKPSFITIQCRGKEVTVYGNVVSWAINRPVSLEQVLEQICKVHNTQFDIVSGDVYVQDGIFVPVQEVKTLRREAIERITAELVTRREVPTEAKNNIAGDCKDTNKDHGSDSITSGQKPYISVLVKNTEQIDAVLEFPEIDRIYYEFADGDFDNLANIAAKVHKNGRECIIALPHIFRKRTSDLFIAEIDKLKKAEFDGFLIRNLDELQFIVEHELKGRRILDYNLYQFNDYSESFFNGYDIDTDTVSFELSRNEISNMNNQSREIVVYGRVVLMLSAQCIMKNFKGCKQSSKTGKSSAKSGMLYIKGMVGHHMPVENRCKWCYNIIYDSEPLNLTEYASVINDNKFKSIRIDLCLEKCEDIGKIINGVCDGFVRGNTAAPDTAYRKGHFLRGVE